jgi:23S rRNA (cytosine1962-C5)-methyltransferase
MAIAKRCELKLHLQRDNFLLINGENDFLPGLFVLLLKDQILIQYYGLFWKDLEIETIPLIKKFLNQYFTSIHVKKIWIQERNFDQKKFITPFEGDAPSDFTLKEFKINYHIKINENYDYGLYTDMSSIRKQLRPYLTDAKNVLNLFCYTGAFSLYALSLGANNVVSVDLSAKYLNWLEDNIKLNPELNSKNHQCLNSPTDKALLKLKASEQKFDIIICDPPSASSDGAKMTNAFSADEALLPLMVEVLAPKGKIFAFLNTHQISWNKFEDKLKLIISTSPFKNDIIIGKRFKLSDDYLPMKGFHEGDYLKGILIELKEKK